MLVSAKETLGHKVHGMKGSMVEADWTPLTMEELGPVLRGYSLDGDGLRVLSISRRPFSAAGVIATPRGPVFVKRHARAVRDAAGLAEEHRFLAHLHSRGVPVPKVLRALSGATAWEAGRWTYELHEVPPGVDLYSEALSWTPYLSVDHAWSAGRMLALVHRAAESFQAPRRKPQPLVASFTLFAGNDPDAGLARYLARHARLAAYPALAEFCREAICLLGPYHARLVPRLGSLPELWTHNDLHGSNLLWSNSSSGAEAIAIFDFGLADRTTAVYDLAQAIDRGMVEWLDPAFDHPDSHASVPVHLDQLEAMLSGYEEIRPLSRAEAAALVPMAALGHAEFALSEADYFYSVLNSEERAAFACSAFLCGHARWFMTPEGQGLLDFLGARAGRSQNPR